jgi:hypothetical protein
MSRGKGILADLCMTLVYAAASIVTIFIMYCIIAIIFFVWG